MGVATGFQAYDRPLETVTSFKYLGRLPTVTYNDWLSVTTNLQKERKSWAIMSRILGREGADTCTLGRFYPTIVQAVMLFGAENWVMTPRIERLLGGFHHRVARRISGKKPRRWNYGTWD